jgi:squalene synthase HpnC
MISRGVNAPGPQAATPYNRGVATPVHGVEHYENFPVASWLMPARLRPAVVAIYRFARHADDIADEGDAAPHERVAALARLRDDLARARAGAVPTEPVVAQLVPHVLAHSLDWSRFDALLSAFEQDVTVCRYADFDALRDYCSRSADPVGQLVLALAGRLDDSNRGLSDRICTALQLINFLQDAAIDWRRGRLYLPLDALAVHGASDADLVEAAAEGRAGPRLRACIADEAQRAATWLAQGSPLASRVGGRIGWELRAVIAGGARILARLAAQDHDPFLRRPVLGPRDALPIATQVARLAIAGTIPLPTDRHRT